MQLHARYIVCTVLLLMPPALRCSLCCRCILQVNVNTAEALVNLVLLVLIVGDKRRGKIWAPYPLAFAVFAVLAVASNHVKDWAWWHGLSGFITGGQV